MRDNSRLRTDATPRAVDDYDIRVQQVVERALAAKFGLWGALLTSHTVMLSVAGALLLAVKPVDAWPFTLIGVIAIICIPLVLLNFVLTKSQYEVMGKRVVNPAAELGETTRVRDLRHAVIRHGFSGVAEIVAVIGVALEAFFSRGHSSTGEGDAQPSDGGVQTEEP